MAARFLGIGKEKPLLVVLTFVVEELVSTESGATS